MRDAFAVFQEAIGTLKKASTTHGGEYAGRCPFPGCTSRENGFRCWPGRDRSDGPSYWCRRCGRHGDLIRFVRECYGYSFTRAKEFLEITDDDFFGGTAMSTPTPRQLSEKWQQAAYLFASEAHQRLWSAEGQYALRYLTITRHLPEPLLRAHRWGCTTLSQYISGEEWGVEGRIYIPAGIVIPLLWDFKVWGMIVRRPDLDVDLMTDGFADRYWMIKGSQQILYGVETIVEDQPVAMVESYIDRLTLLDKIPYPVVATGSTSGCRGDEWAVQLAKASVVLQAFDSDEPGEEAAQWWKEHLANVTRCKPPAKDVNKLNALQMEQFVQQIETCVEMMTGLRMPRLSEDFFAAEEQVAERPVLKPSVTPPDDRRAFFLAEYSCKVCQGTSLSNSFLHVKSGHYCPWCYDQAPEFMAVKWRLVEGMVPMQGRIATFLLTWIVEPNIAAVTRCYMCEEQGTFYDLAGRLWCAKHAPAGAAETGMPHGVINEILPDEETNFDFEHCAVCGQEATTVDEHARTYCAYHLIPDAAEVDGLYHKLLDMAQELRAIYAVAPEIFYSGSGCDRCGRYSMYDGQGGTHWCDVHKSGYELLEDGLQIGYPDLAYPGGNYLGEQATAGKIDAGRTAWIRFASEAPVVQVWAAKVHTWNIICGRENIKIKVLAAPRYPCARYLTVGCRGSHMAQYARTDCFGNLWCPDCHCAAELLDEGDDAGFPALGFYTSGHDIYMKGGYKAYEDFVFHQPSLVALETTRNMLRDLVKAKQST